MINMLPRFLREIKEYALIFSSVENELYDCSQKLDEMEKENFVSTAEKKGLTFWESLFHLPSTGTLEERRIRVLARRNVKKEVTMEWLEQKLNQVAEKGTWKTDVDGYTLKLKLTPTVYSARDTIIKAIRQEIPARLVLVVSEYLNLWEEAKEESWKNEKNKTWYQEKYFEGGTI